MTWTRFSARTTHKSALAGQLQPARAGPLGELTQHPLIAADSSATAGSRSSVTSVIWCLLRLGGYAVEITVPVTETG
jgi:hypothetical protein